MDQCVREVDLSWLACEITGRPSPWGILGFCDAVRNLLLGAAQGVALTAVTAMRFTSITFWRLLGAPAKQ